MNRLLNLSAALLSLGCLPQAVLAADSGKKPVKAEARKAVKVSKAVPAPKAKSEVKTAKKSPAKPKQVLATTREAETLRAVALEPEVPVSVAQLEIAGRVLTGTADCELNQTVRVEPQQDRPGHFRVAFRNTTYTMVPEETSTGAVRLYDPRAEVVWLQIPTKSMLMNAKVGQRVVDACMQTEQRIAAAASASTQTASALGWSTPLPPAVPALAASLALPAAQAAVTMQPVSALAATMPIAPTSEMATLAVAPAAPAAPANLTPAASTTGAAEPAPSGAAAADAAQLPAAPSANPAPHAPATSDTTPAGNSPG